MTDFELKREVESELNWDPEVKSAAAIGVSVKDGIVTLRGHVDSFIEKLAAGGYMLSPRPWRQGRCQ